MRNGKRLMKTVSAIIIYVFLWGGFCVYANPKEKNWITINKIDFEEKRGGSAGVLVQQTLGGNSQSRQWMEVKSVFSNQGDWIDNVKVRFLVLLMNKKPESEGRRLNTSDFFKLLVKDEEFVNVPQGKDFTSKVYIHPHTLARFGEIAQMRVEIYRNGALDAELIKDFTNSKEKKQFDFREWWKRFPLLGGSLLSPSDTPYLLEPQMLAKKIE